MNSTVIWTTLKDPTLNRYLIHQGGHVLAAACLQDNQTCWRVTWFRYISQSQKLASFRSFTLSSSSPDEASMHLTCALLLLKQASEQEPAAPSRVTSQYLPLRRSVALTLDSDHVNPQQTIQRLQGHASHFGISAL